MEYLEQRRELVEITEELYREKLITPSGGNLSLRLPDDQGFLITPSMMFKGGLKPEDLVLLDPQGKPVERRSRPSVETPMHIKIYQMNPKVGAVIHTHAPYATIAGLYGLSIPPITLEAVRFHQLPVVPFCLPGSRDLVNQVAAALEKEPTAQALLLQNHGLLTMGRTLRLAANASMSLEEACHMATICRLLGGELKLIEPEKVEFLKKITVL
ncbi:MAG TPA: class II aldolase/adducin family protein [Bacillota bacterium]|nr:class II aldolase/adducin family protein [Bacillota bacterium]